MSGLTYYSRLKVLSLESLELRRIRADLILVYKIVFGQLCVASDAFFFPRAQSQLRGHPYVLSKQRCSSSLMRTFFNSPVINMWNNLPVSSTNFSSLSFCKTVPSTYLINFCRVNFTWLRYILLCYFRCLWHHWCFKCQYVLRVFHHVTKDAACQRPPGPLLFNKLDLTWL